MFSKSYLLSSSMIRLDTTAHLTNLKWFERQPLGIVMSIALRYAEWCIFQLKKRNTRVSLHIWLHLDEVSGSINRSDLTLFVALKVWRGLFRMSPPVFLLYNGQLQIWTSVARGVDELFHFAVPEIRDSFCAACLGLASLTLFSGVFSRVLPGFAECFHVFRSFS